MKVVCSLLSLIMASLVIFSCARDIEVQFDALFPATPYKKVLDTCMQTYGDMEYWLESCSIITDDVARTNCVQLIVGRLSYIGQAITQMRNKQPIILPEDKEYLQRIVAHIQQLSNKLITNFDPILTELIQEQFVNIEQDLAQF